MGKLPSFILAILVVVVALTGWQTMRLNAQMTEFSAETGRLAARIDGVFNNIEGMKADLRANSLNLTSAKKLLASLDSNMARIAGDVNRIAARIHDVEATPTDVLRMAGMKVNDWYFGSKFTGNKKIWSESTRDNALFLSTAIQLNSEQLQPIYDWFNNSFHVLESTARLDPNFTYDLYQQEKYKKEINRFLSIADLDIEELKITEEDFDSSKLPSDIPDDIKNKICEDMKDKKLLDVSSVHKSIQGEDVYFDFNEESDGTKKFVAFIGPWIDTLEKGNVLVIDELHDNFHPLMVRFLIELFHSKEINKNNAQLIFTSHETSVMTQEIFRRDQIWFCEKKNKATELFSLVEFKPRKGVTDIEKSYFSGRYGALPYFKNIDRAMGVQYVEEI